MIETTKVTSDLLSIIFKQYSKIFKEITFTVGIEDEHSWENFVVAASLNNASG